MLSGLAYYVGFFGLSNGESVYYYNFYNKINKQKGLV